LTATTVELWLGGVVVVLVVMFLQSCNGSDEKVKIGD